MKSLIVAAVLGVSSLGVYAEGLKLPTDFPGSNWSALTLHPGVVKGTPEDGNLLLQGKIEQGAIWARFGDNDKWALNTYVSLGYSADRNKLYYNNKLSPAIGVKVSRSFESGVVDIGVQAVHETYFHGITGSPKSGSGVQAYASYWFGWNLGK